MANKGWTSLSPYLHPYNVVSLGSREAYTVHAGRVYLRANTLAWAPAPASELLLDLPEEIRPEAPQPVTFGGKDADSSQSRLYHAVVYPDGTMRAPTDTFGSRGAYGSYMTWDTISWPLAGAGPDSPSGWQNLPPHELPGLIEVLEPLQYAVHDNMVHFRGRFKIFVDTYTGSTENELCTMWTTLPLPPKYPPTSEEPRVSEENTAFAYLVSEQSAASLNPRPFPVTLSAISGNIFFLLPKDVHTKDTTYNISEWHWHWPLWKSGFMCLV